MPVVLRKYRRPYMRMKDFLIWSNLDLEQYGDIIKKKEVLTDFLISIKLPAADVFFERYYLGCKKGEHYLEFYEYEDESKLGLFNTIRELTVNQLIDISHGDINHYRLKDGQTVNDIKPRRQKPKSRFKIYKKKQYIYKDIEAVFLARKKNSLLWGRVFCFRRIVRINNKELLSEVESYQAEYSMIQKFGIRKYTMKSLKKRGFDTRGRGAREWDKKKKLKQ